MFWFCKFSAVYTFVNYNCLFSCQVMLRASCGINYEEFVEFLDVIAKQRICNIREKVIDATSVEKNLNNQTSLSRTDFKSSVFQDWSSSMVEGQGQLLLIDYCRHDLVKVKECLISLKGEHSFNELQNKDLQIRIDELLQEIHTTLENKQT